MNKKHLIKIIILTGTLLNFANNNSLLSKNISPKMAQNGTRALQELGLTNVIVAAWNKDESSVISIKKVYNVQEKLAKEKLLEKSTKLKEQVTNLVAMPINIQNIINEIKKLDISNGKNMKEFGDLILELIREAETTKDILQKLMEQGPPLSLFLQGNMFIRNLQD